MQGEAVLQLTTEGLIQEEVSLLEADEVLIQDRSVAAGGREEACQSGIVNQRQGSRGIEVKDAVLQTRELVKVPQVHGCHPSPRLPDPRMNACTARESPSENLEAQEPMHDHDHHHQDHQSHAREHSSCRLHLSRAAAATPKESEGENERERGEGKADLSLFEASKVERITPIDVV